MKTFFGLAMIAVSSSVASAAPAPPQIAKQLVAILSDHKADTPGIVGEMLTVWTPDWKWSGTVGKVSGTDRPLTPQHAFRTASLTKSFTAAAILRLMETGKLDITQPISDCLSEETSALLSAGGYEPSKITVQQLLNHSSGIYDYATDPKFRDKVFSDPTYQWTRVEQIKHAMDNGKPVGKPGEVASYSDTGYIILGEIVERETGQNLASAVRSLINFNKIGLNDTYWEQLEPKPKSSKAPFNGNMFTDLDLTKANHSFDLFGGGGLISTTQDLAIFYRALVRGEIFDNRRTLAVLLTFPSVKRSVDDSEVYGNGVHPIQLGQNHCFGHTGFWGQYVAYCPGTDITFTWSLNYAGEVNEKINFFQRLADVVKR
jgi:D-alanyl-D-alanine carboxypeptidase